MPENDDGFGLDEAAVGDYRKDTLRAGLNALTGYGSIVIVQPDRPVFNTLINDAAANSETAKNNGNATVSLDNVRHCKSGNTDCGTVTREFILPGRARELQKKDGFKKNFPLIEGSDKRALSY